MKSGVLSFFKPRFWTVLFTLLLVAWQYIYAFRGVDIGILTQMRTYFGAGLTVVSWNNFFIRTFSLGLIWLLVALTIFAGLWLAENYVVGSHNRKVARNYVNQPKVEFAHLLHSRNVSFKKHFISHLWLSAFIVLIPIGFIYLSTLLEMLRSNIILSYVVTVQESGSEVDYNNVSLTVVSFLGMIPLYYLYSCFDSWCLLKSRQENTEAKIEDDHYAIPVVAATPEEQNEFGEDDAEGDSNLPASPVI